MDKLQEKQLQEIIRNQQNFLISQAKKSRPAGHNVGDEDLSKVASNDIIGKGGQSDLIK
jgi:hypothetical protein